MARLEKLKSLLDEWVTRDFGSSETGKEIEKLLGLDKFIANRDTVTNAANFLDHLNNLGSSSITTKEDDDDEEEEEE
eukprot:CAMPEP_0116558510 /NCGR_PEP_ID=MMETSP0397-20121206/9850_1 /TAXON_ID=216820 /ORGANISM="Cyclophora tenuis, Strain ECT3854" /LENGTH=76 /DNA_ID=CAMNT_0004084115 /DNA_START=1214 /DNA_END=1444 /DNA_ORIENTATION=+